MPIGHIIFYDSSTGIGKLEEDTSKKCRMWYFHTNNIVGDLDLIEGDTVSFVSGIHINEIGAPPL